MEECNHNFEYVKEDTFVSYEDGSEHWKTYYIVMCKKCGLVKKQLKYE